MSLLNIVPLTLFGLFSIFIGTKKQKRPHDFVLLAINLVIGLTLIFDLPFVQNDITGWKLFVHFYNIFLLSTLFMIYAYSVVKPGRSLVVKWWFFAFSVPYLVFSLWDLLLSGHHTTESLLTTLETPGWVYHAFFKLHKLFVIGVCFHILKKIKTHDTRIKNAYSQIERHSLNWLRNYTIAVIGLYSFHLVIFLLYNTGILAQLDLPYTITGILGVLMALYLSFYGIKFYSASEELPLLPKEATALPKPSPTSAANHSKAAENAVIYQQVLGLFDQEQMFTNPDLRISAVAKKINVPVHRLSEAINDQFKQPFYDLVAHHRCALLKEKLVDPDNKSFTILALAMDAGFNSKSSLNRIFKEQTGLTPSQYKKSHLPK